MSKQSRVLKLISRDSVGVYRSKEWMEKGDSLLASSRELRLSWTLNQRKLKRTLKNLHLITEKDRRLFSSDKHLLGPSYMLLGYAAEMYLKAGLATVIHGCSEQLFKHLSSKEYGHKLQKIAQSIYFKLDKESSTDLVDLQAFIESEGRYPIEADDRNDLINQSNSLRLRSSNKTYYRRLCRLVERIARHSADLGGNRRTPASTGTWQYDDDGYISLWLKTGLPPRITYRLSQKLTLEREPMVVLREMIRSLPGLNAAWPHCDLYEEVVGAKVALKRRQIIE
ncbi:TPA: hypothetical protein QDZ12_004794 [Pseudomonas putida]|nr:hypothetical protein [Pseudomonas putida]